MGMIRTWLLALLAVGFFVAPGRLAAGAEAGVDFQHQIRPLLSDRCFACHGPDEAERYGGFRMDQIESALGRAASGRTPIVAGDRGASEVYRRLTAEEEHVRMPPASINKPLSAEEIEAIGQWIDEGAVWEEHWSFVAPVRPEMPVVEGAEWVRNEIDHFILARLEREGLEPQAEADRATLIRRVAFDLTGLPPTLEEVDAFLADDSPDAYERLVDRLLERHHFGEHQARFWLDAARYGDTHGLHLDNFREMWPYRDWVVQAFNRNLPYDQFTIEQLAGDLLPDPTRDQLIATGFNRAHVTTNEGGSITEEVLMRNVVDRVVTTGTVFMALTMDCTRCHDHKYDPLTAQDFYSLYAFFNSLDGDPMDGNRKDPAPVVSVWTDSQREELADLRSSIESLEADIARRVAEYEYAEPEEAVSEAVVAPEERVWIDDHLPPGARPEGEWRFVGEPVFRGERSWQVTAEGRDQVLFTGASDPLQMAEGDVWFVHVYLDPQDPPRQLMLQWNAGSWDHRAFWGGDYIDWGQLGTPSRREMGPLPTGGEWVRLEVPAQHVGLAAGARVHGWAFTQFGGTAYWDAAGLVTTAGRQPVYRSLAKWWSDQRAGGGEGLPEPLLAWAQREGDTLSEDEQRRVRDHFIENAYAGAREELAPLHQQLHDAEQRIQQMESSAATTLVFRERAEPRPAHILERGEYDQVGREVPRATPAMLPPMPDDAPTNRLGLAQWLVEPAHPLTARVAVNRFWQQVFGTGLVKTADDFGSQGERPSHPQLLDWLAVEFRESGWDVKGLYKQLVMSATYRQASRIDPRAGQRDPENRLLARGPRFRLDAEMLRDQALSVSGLLVDQPGGPSVKPPQPDGLWFAVGYSGSNTVRFQADQGSDKVHRRTLYTFIKRTAPPPQLSTFDAPSREACTVRRDRTNTPQQALLLMNDPQYVEAARGLAERTLREAGASAAARAGYLFRLCTARWPSDAELAELVALYGDHRDVFQESPQAAEQLLAVGELPADFPAEAPEAAAWLLVANMVLNLDEVVTKN